MPKRGSDGGIPRANERIGLPYRPFLFTIDQISVMLNIKVETLVTQYIFFQGRSTGLSSHNLMIARNIAPATAELEWRIAERELLRWMKRKGFKHYEPTTLSY